MTSWAEDMALAARDHDCDILRADTGVVLVKHRPTGKDFICTQFSSYGPPKDYIYVTDMEKIHHLYRYRIEKIQQWLAHPKRKATTT